jgi:DNA-binding Lrp family transcriptional regulator
VTGSGSPRLWVGMAGAIVRVRVAHEVVQDVVGLLAHDPRTKSVYRLAGSDAVLAHVVAADHTRLNQWLVHRVDALPGMHATDTQLVTGTYQEASTWRLDVLSPAQHGLLRATRTTPVEAGGGAVRPERVRPLLHALGQDGRANAAALARRATGWPRSTVQRRLGDLLRGGLLATRCDVSQESVGYPITLWLFGSAAAAELPRTLRMIAALPEVRLLLTTTGQDNVVLGAWLRQVEQVLELEHRLSQVAPSLRVRNRDVALRTAKIQGWILDEAGRATHPVPIDPWSDTLIPSTG